MSWGPCRQSQAKHVTSLVFLPISVCSSSTSNTSSRHPARHRQHRASKGRPQRAGQPAFAFEKAHGVIHIGPCLNPKRVFLPRPAPIPRHGGTILPHSGRPPIPGARGTPSKRVRAAHRRTGPWVVSRRHRRKLCVHEHAAPIPPCHAPSCLCLGLHAPSRPSKLTRLAPVTQSLPRPGTCNAAA